VALTLVEEGGRTAPLAAVYLSDVYFPRVNGVSTSIATFRRELPRWGVETALVAPDYGDEPQAPNVVRVRGRPVPLDPEDRFVAPRRLARAAAGLPCDLVHVQTPFSAHRAGIRLARARGVPLVETWHTDFEGYLEHYLPLFPHRWLRALARRLARKVATEVDHLVVPSSTVAERIAGLAATVSTTVVPTGVEPGELGAGDGGRFRALHGIPPRRPVAVHVGRVAHEKNIEFLLRVTAYRVRGGGDLLLVIAGEGPASGQLRRAVADLGIERHVLFVGYLDRRGGLADCYRAGDCFVFASHTETQGLVLLEAMSLGVPVVSVAANGTLDLLATGRGALVSSAEVDAFAAAIDRVLGERGLAARLGEEGRRLASEWSPAGFAGRLAGLYRRLVRRGQPFSR
jgi:glycosyltransferase involved in cell wall biosynthesis